MLSRSTPQKTDENYFWNNHLRFLEMVLRAYSKWRNISSRKCIKTRRQQQVLRDLNWYPLHPSSLPFSKMETPLRTDAAKDTGLFPPAPSPRAVFRRGAGQQCFSFCLLLFVTKAVFRASVAQMGTRFFLPIPAHGVEVLPWVHHHWVCWDLISLPWVIVHGWCTLGEANWEDLRLPHPQVFSS